MVMRVTIVEVMVVMIVKLVALVNNVVLVGMLIVILGYLHARREGNGAWYVGARGRAAAERLSSHLDVQWLDYPMDHSVCLEELQDLQAFLNQVLPAPA